MKTAAEIRSEPVSQRRSRRESRPARRQPDGFYQFLRIRNFEPHDVACRELPGLKFAHPLFGVNAQNVFITGRIGFQKVFFLREPLAKKHLVNQPEFL